MKPSTPLWLLTSTEMPWDRFVPLKKPEVDGMKFYYLRRDAPPHEPGGFSALRQEFHHKIGLLSGEVAIDVGANIGSYTLRLAKKFTSVIAFEPNHANSYVLELNIATNKLDNIRVEEVALSDRNETAPLYIRGGGATSLDPSHYGLKCDKVKLVRTMKLDDFPRISRKVDFLKIDAEGHELPILRGARRTIDRFKPILGVEVHRGRVASGTPCACDTCDFLNGCGYDLEITGELATTKPVPWVWGVPRND